MIKLQQMAGTGSGGRRVVHNFDRVLSVEDGRTQVLGYVDRKPNAKLACIARLTDDEKVEVMNAINAERQGTPWGPVTPPDNFPPADAVVEEWEAEQDELEDDEDE